MLYRCALDKLVFAFHTVHPLSHPVLAKLSPLFRNIKLVGLFGEFCFLW
jgi:hypothetical protein